MGVLLSCCRNSSSETALITPDLETKRRQQAEAAERRMKEQERRGIKEPERLKEKIERLERLEKKHEKAARVGDDSTTLKLKSPLEIQMEKQFLNEFLIHMRYPKI